MRAMMAEMDDNGDGTIEFEEFAIAMHFQYDDDLLESAAKVRNVTKCPTDSIILL